MYNIKSTMRLTMIYLICYSASTTRNDILNNNRDAGLKSSISITSPVNGASVSHREKVEGKVSDSKATVCLIIRPAAGSDYFVQPPVDVNRDGTWSAVPYFGESESANIGEHFKVMAIANPVKKLNEGDKLRYWPDAQSKSFIIEVIKK